MKLIPRILLSTLLLLLPGSVGAQFASSPLITAAPGFLPFTINVKSQGATGGFQTFESAVMTASSTTLTKNNGAVFTPASVGNRIIVTGALGVSSAPLDTTIATYVSATQVTLADQATHATSNAFLSSVLEVDSTVSTGNYVPGETLACTGGTPVAGANCTTSVYTTAAVINSVVSAGTGATASLCYLSTTTGTGAPLIARYAIVAGSISGAATIVSAGTYFTNPTTLANAVMVDARGNCGITGVILNLSTTVSTLRVETVGEYSPTPSVNMTTGAGSTSGATGITFSGSWTTTGQGGFGIDDTVAIKRAQDLAIAQYALGRRSVIYFPPGNYLVNGGAAGATSLSICNGPCSYVGDAISATALTVGPGYTGAAAGSGLLVWHNSWLSNDAPNNGGTLNFNASLFGASVDNLQFIGYSTSTPEITAMLFQGRNTNVRIRNVECGYMGSCIRGGILNGTSDNVANIQESEFIGVRTRLVGTSTYPAVHITAQDTGAGFSIAVPNNNNFIDFNIFAPGKDGFVLDAVGPSVKSGGNNKAVNFRVEGGPRRGAIGAGDLFRIGNPAATSNVALGSFSIVDLNLIGPIADTGTATFYCALRIASRYTSNISVLNSRITSASGGSNAVCIDGGSSIRLHFIALTSALYDISVGANPTVGNNIEINLMDDPTANSPYRWNIDSSSLANLNTHILLKNNSIFSTSTPAGAYSFAGAITANTAGTFAPSGLWGSITGTFTTTTAVTWPTSVNFIRVVASSQGGCGGGGGMQTLGTLVTGGGAGGGGIIFDRIYKRAELGNSTTFTLGTPCTPGAGALVIGNGTAGGTGGAAGAGASVAYTLANGTVVTAYGGGYGGASNATGSIGGGGAGFGGAGIANVAGSGVTFTNFMGGFGGGGGAVGASTSGNVGWQATGAGGGGASTTTGLRGGDSYNCPGGGSGGTLLIASASVGGNGGSTPYQFAVPAGGAATGATGGAGVLHSFATGGSAPGGGGANAAGAGGTGGSAALVPCAGGSGGGSGTTRGGDAGAVAPPTVTYVAW